MDFSTLFYHTIGALGMKVALLLILSQILQTDSGPADIFCGLHNWECCGDYWTKPDHSKTDPNTYSSLTDVLEEKIHGQHIAVGIIGRVVKKHVENPSPKKALVLSLHGSTGTGKNFASEIVAKYLYKNGLDSRFVHLIIGTHHFPHKAKIEQYKQDLKDWVHGNVSQCERSFFIFDEVDKIPRGLVDVLKPFLGSYNKVDGTDFRRSIFFFLSNGGGKKILQELLELEQSGKRREDLKAERLDALLSKEALQIEGLWNSGLINDQLIGFFVPFLPLERSHVKLCARTYMKERGYTVTEDKLQLIADQMEYFPEEEKIFSLSGCKKVAVKVDFIIG